MERRSIWLSIQRCPQAVCHLCFCKKQFRFPLPWSTSWEQRREGPCAAKSQHSPEQPNKPWAQAIFIYFFYSFYFIFSPTWHTDNLYDLKTVPLPSWFFFFVFPTGTNKRGFHVEWDWDGGVSPLCTLHMAVLMCKYRQLYQSDDGDVTPGIKTDFNALSKPHKSNFLEWI